MSTLETQREQCLSHLYQGLPLFSSRLVVECELPWEARPKIESAADAVDFLRPYFKDRDREEMVAVLICPDSTVLGIAHLSTGSRGEAFCEPLQVFKAAILANARALILVHNHPVGNPEPSQNDLETTRKLVEAGELLLIPIIDHLIISSHGYVSLEEQGFFRDDKQEKM